jgi:uncharacterized protein (DUF4415 family)
MTANLKSIAKRKRDLIPPTPEEDAEINRQIAADPDTFDTADPKNARFLRPAPEMKAKVLEIVKRYRGQRGPQKAPTKDLISIRIDPDVLEFFKKSGPGWQSKLNGTLRQQMERMLEQMESHTSALSKSIEEARAGKAGARDRRRRLAR